MASGVTHKLDIDFVRSLLIKIQSRDLFEDNYYSTDSRECYHLKKMIEGGLVEGWALPDGFDEGWSAEISDITFKGHEFLQAISGSSVWNKVKEVALAKGIGLTIDCAIKIAKSFL